MRISRRPGVEPSALHPDSTPENDHAGFPDLFVFSPPARGQIAIGILGMILPRSS
jgi:hypothetical protein